MECALWLNRRKIYHADEISDNLDVASLRGYFLGGSLVKWLRDNGGAQYADRLDELNADDPDLNEKLSAVFRRDSSPSVPSRALTGSPSPYAPMCRGTGIFGLSKYGSLGSFRFGSFRNGSFRNGSFRIGSFSFGSFRKNSFMHEWEWEYVLGSFRKGSFGYGSFRKGSFSHEWEWEYSAGSFRKGSFRSGSFRLGSFRPGSLGYGSFGAKMPFGLSGRRNGSFDPFVMISPDEYDRIMYETLRKCPLDRFGYGIHII